MEVSALNRWQSIGSDLYKLGTIEKELSLFEKYKMDERIRAYEAKLKEQEKQARHEKLHHLKDGDEKEFKYVLEKNDVEKMFVEFVYRALRRIWKGFMIGFGIRAGFQVIGALLRSKGNISKLLSTIPTILTGDASRYGLFVGFVFMIFESVMRASRYTMGVKNPNKTSFIGGVVAGLSLFLIPADSRVTIMMFFLVRALEMIAKGGVSSGIIPNIPHAEILVMMAASAQVTYAGMMHRECVEPSYMHFLDHHSQKSRPQLNAFNSLANGNMNDKSVDVINEWRKGMGKTPLDVNSHRAMCDIMHPHISENCEVAMLDFYREAFKRAIPVYLPVYLIPMILFRRKQLVSQPLNTIKDNTLAISRSSLFLASYCTMGMYEICWMRRILGNYWRLGIAMSGVVGGACVSIEKPHRRIELTLYVLTQAILAGYRIGAKKGWLPIIKHGEVALFCASMGVLMHTYITAPYLMRPSYFSLFRFCFGSGGVMEGFPRFQQIRRLSGVDVDAKEGDSSALKHSDSFIVKELVKRTIPDSNSPPRTSSTNSHSDRTIIAELQRLSPPHSPPHGKENEAPAPTRSNVLNGVGKPSYALKTTKPVMMDGMRGANGKARMDL